MLGDKPTLQQFEGSLFQLSGQPGPWSGQILNARGEPTQHALGHENPPHLDQRAQSILITA